MKAARLAAEISQAILTHGPEVEVWWVDPATGERLELQLQPAIATVAQPHGGTKAVVYFALTPGQAAALRTSDGTR